MHSCAFSTVLWKLQSSISIAHALSMWLLDYEITILWQGLLTLDVTRCIVRAPAARESLVKFLNGWHSYH